MISFQDASYTSDCCLPQIYDLYAAIYQTVWNTTKTNRGLFQARQDLWDRLKRGVQNIPKGHMLLIAGDFNTPLDRDPPHIYR